jgi:hypothetical protein
MQQGYKTKKWKKSGGKDRKEKRRKRNKKGSGVAIPLTPSASFVIKITL